MSKLIETLVVDLTKKVDAGFADVREDIRSLELTVKDHSNRLDMHSMADTSANARVDKAEARISALESRPVRIIKKAAALGVAVIGVVSTLVGLIWTILQMKS